MNIRGLSFYHAYSCIVILVNNELKFVIKEKRIKKEKIWFVLPILIIKELLNFYSIIFANIDLIIIKQNSTNILIKK
jgi:hypothetical protein